MNEKYTFCFHSVRSMSQIPLLLDKDEQYSFKLRVEPSWFYEWIQRATDYYGPSNLCITFDDAYRDSMIPAITCASLGVRTIMFVPTKFIGGYLRYIPMEIMDEAELIHLGKSCVELGSHGHSHVPFTHLGRYSLEEEVRESLAILEGLYLKIDNSTDDSELHRFSLAPPHGVYTVDQYHWFTDMGLIKEVYGTVVWPTKDSSGERTGYGTPRLLASMDGYCSSSDWKTVQWPWEK